MRILDDCTDQCQPFSVLRRAVGIAGIPVALIVALVSGPAAAGEAIPVPPPNMPEPAIEIPKEEPLQAPIRRLSDGVFQIGNVMVDQKKRQIQFKGTVNMQRGLVEYLAVADRGKLHESVLSMDVEPFHLQLGLLILGLEYGRNLKFQGDPNAPQGDPLEIWVEWMEDGKARRARGEDLVWNQQTGRPMKHTAWVFTGSLEVEGTFVAQVERSLIATYHDPASIIDNPLPEGADDTILYANEKLVPPAGTAVVVTLQAKRP